MPSRVFYLPENRYALSNQENFNQPISYLNLRAIELLENIGFKFPSEDLIQQTEAFIAALDRYQSKLVRRRS